MTTFRLLFTAAPPDTTRRSGPTLGDGLRLRTPSRPVLHEAARLGDLPTIRQACDLGNDIDGLRFGFTALQLAAKTGRTDAVMLLLDLGASVRARATTGETALHGAAEHNRTHVMTQLLARGADLHTQTHTGETPLHSCAVGGWLRATRLLIAHGSDPHAANRQGDTPHAVALCEGYGRCTCTDPTAREWAQVAG